MGYAWAELCTRMQKCQRCGDYLEKDCLLHSCNFADLELGAPTLVHGTTEATLQLASKILHQFIEVNVMHVIYIYIYVSMCC